MPYKDPEIRKAKQVEASRRSYLKNREKVLARQADKRKTDEGKEQFDAYIKRWRAAHPEKEKEYQARHREKVKEERRVKDRTPERRAKINAYRRDREKRDPAFRIERRLRAQVYLRIRRLTTGKRCHTSTQELVGCTWAELVAHLESTAPTGFTWEGHNRDEWHIDHIKPCAAFDLTDESQQRECFHYSNLRIIPALENRSKSDILPNGTRARDSR